MGFPNPRVPGTISARLTQEDGEQSGARYERGPKSFCAVSTSMSVIQCLGCLSDKLPFIRMCLCLLLITPVHNVCCIMRTLCYAFNESIRESNQQRLESSPKPFFTAITRKCLLLIFLLNVVHPYFFSFLDLPVFLDRLFLIDDTD